MTLPLNGIQDVEVSSFVAAPLCGMTLAQLGAEVIRVDPIGGAADYRRWPLAVKDERELRGFTARLEELDIRTLFVIGGDDVAIGDFNEASEILEALEGFAHGITRIGVGCFIGALSDPNSRYGLHSGPLPCGCSWRITRDLPRGNAQVGDRHLKFHEDRDNLGNDKRRAAR